VVVVGSGAGGGVIAAELAAGGRSVIVVEGGGYFDGESAVQWEVMAAPSVFYRGGGFTATSEGNVNLWAGATLGGGTTVNWSNCVRPPAPLRHNWATEHGVSDVDTPAFDEHLDAVLARMGANDEVSVYNGPHLRLTEGAARLGWQHRRAVLNLDPHLIDSPRGSHLTYGDRTGAKQGTLRTFLVDAAAKDARVLVRTSALRILVRDGRAAGVEATYTDPSGTTARVLVRAPQVVAAGGALETPALLLRSSIGGPAVGDYLRLHPAGGVVGVYDEPQKGWWGAPQTGLSREFADLEDGYGFLVESSAALPGLGAATVPWHGGRIHKDWMAAGPTSAPFVFLIRDRGTGRVGIDDNGNAVWHYAMTDRLDDRHYRRAQAELVRLHAAAGAKQIISYHRTVSHWTEGEDPETFAAALHDAPLDPYDCAKFALHQMGSARMGNDPKTSVADPWGELHDTPGVWIGDASAFPTASGTNPMITVMALARRTAAAMNAAGR